MRKKVKIAIIIAGILLVICSIITYLMLFQSVVSNKYTEKIRVRKNWSLQQLADTLQQRVGLTNSKKFVSWCNTLRYQQVKPCFISIEPGSGYYSIISQLKKNRYQEVNISINGSANLDNISKIVTSKLEVDPDSLKQFFADKETLEKYQFTPENIYALFIPNTYSFNVNTNFSQFIIRLQKEYNKFWNAENKNKAEKQKLSVNDVISLASIVSKESNKTDEYNNIAGVYINRLRKDMLLQADPTVVFAKGKGGRVSYADLEIKNAYNTYIHKGLPPGPICVPNMDAIMAVLNYRQHNYIFFCAKEDFSGYHNFSETYEEHKKNAEKFHKALEELEKKKKNK